MQYPSKRLHVSMRNRKLYLWDLERANNFHLVYNNVLMFNNVYNNVLVFIENKLIPKFQN